MAVSITIAGTDKTSSIDWKKLRREEVLTKEPNSLTFLIRKHDGQTYKPTVGDEVIMTVGGTREFGGFIVERKEVVRGHLEFIECICKDYTHALDRELVSKTYEDQTVNQIISDLLSTFSTGFTDNNVDCDITIDKLVFNYLPISRCLEKITELVGDYDWYVDYDKDLHFFNVEAQLSTFDMTDTAGNYVFNSLSVREDTHQLRNQIVIRGGLLTSSTVRTETLDGDGSKTIFPLASKFASKPAVSVGGSSITVGIANLDNTGYQVYWNYNEKYLDFYEAPTTGANNIAATQLYEYPLILEKRNEDSITTYGLFEHIIIDKTIKDLETAGLRADAELIRYSVPAKSADFITYSSGIKTGDTVNVQSDIRGIDQDFKVQVIRSKLRKPDADDMEHTVEAITADDLGINDILAKLLIKNPADQIDISQDEVVSRIRQFEDSFNITDSTPTGSFTTGPYLYDNGDLWGFSVWGS